MEWDCRSDTITDSGEPPRFGRSEAGEQRQRCSEVASATVTARTGVRFVRFSNPRGVLVALRFFLVFFRYETKLLLLPLSTEWTTSDYVYCRH